MGVPAYVVIQRRDELDKREEAAREEAKDAELRQALLKDVEVRRALILMLGQYGKSELTWPERSALVPGLLEIYHSHPDPGLHAAAEWLLLKWADEAKLDQIGSAAGTINRKLDAIDRKLATGKLDPRRNWYLTTRGHTMVLIPLPPDKGKFQMGSPEGQRDRAADEHLREARIGRPFYVSSKEVTCRQFEPFLTDLRKRSPNVQWTADPKRSPKPDCPVMRLRWDLAAQYCNWLSEEERLPKCYVENKQGFMEEAKDCLTLPGYRLPREAEWEWFSLSGAVTGRYFGRASELLDQYAWHHENAGNESHPVGRKKPNDFGLFDVYGNAWEWCHDVYRRYLPDGTPGEPYPDQRVCRGGANYGSPPWYLRSPFRYWFERSQQDYDVGFRLARTRPADR
jgi:formylglycine-generating enzyme required for sulfatase activity